MTGSQEETRYFAVGLDHVEPARRMAYWNEAAGGRLVCRETDPDGPPVRANVRGLIRSDAELLDYQASGFLMDRTASACRCDGRDEICVGLVAGALTRAEQNGQQMSLERGSLYVVDFARPVRSLVTDHHEIVLVLPRAVAAGAVGGALDGMAGNELQMTAIGRLFASHLEKTAEEAPRLSPMERNAALRVARDLAVATLIAATDAPVEFEAFAGGLYAAAKALIARRCGESSLTPERLEQMLGCSRASLYRVFSAHGEGVAEAIWDARLNRAHTLLSEPARPGLTVSEVAYRSGFLDPSGFSRMFRRRFGVTPSETLNTFNLQGQDPAPDSLDAGLSK